MLLTELTADPEKSRADAKAIAEKIRIKLAEVYKLKITQEGKAEKIIEYPCSASIGVFVFMDHKTSADDILKYADKAMYQAKTSGRNRVRFAFQT